jgi:glycosyltransferase involved in cell wall biosynthesis
MTAPRNLLLVGTYGFHRRKSVALFATALSDRLPALGWNVRIASLSSPLSQLAQRRHSRPLALIDRLLLLRQRILFAGMRADVVHFTDTSDALFINGWFGSKTTVTCHDLIYLERALSAPDTTQGQRLLQKAILRGLEVASGVAFVSQSSAAAFQRTRAKAPGNAIERTIPNGPYQEFQIAGPAERNRLLAPLFPAGTSFVLNVGSNFARKNRPGVLRAFAAANLPTPTRLVMVGERMHDNHRQLCRELGIDQRIVELPEIDTPLLGALYAAAIGLIFPSFEEGFGVPILEAQMCGCPVVCSDIPVFHEVAGDSALLAPASDADALGARLRELTDPDRRAVIVAAGHRNASRFTLDSMARGYADFFNAVANQR